MQEINVQGCVECKRFEEWWKAASAGFPNVRLEKISTEDPSWQELILKHKIFSSPGIIINGELFSTGGVDTKKLAEKLKELGG